ncbi:uncharacterized protein EV422DRAFT_32656 [Fimicolochytrium jonesii]|uniref:uncharacterized protein n=1 Tax=Fimicolochytrium jonesii TaxID=1396493 RepID=UPI0022FDDBA9|nr:uncharacterized protein EV422DRAFT_32656 [Fimicolochytrium jonesii]KAI8827225.1 hypothetical protein EV422DRAFT_32656 [Fimicolochytrium jonesii]
MFSIVKRVTNPDPAVPQKASDAVRVGLLGASRICLQSVIGPARSLESVIVHAVAARDGARAVAFAQKHDIPKSYGDYESLLADPDVDVIYIALPNSLHAEWTIKALQAKKNVLVEKPAASNAVEAAAIKRELDANPGLIVCENYHNLFHPALRRLRDIVASGILGTIRTASAVINVPNLFGMEDIRFKYSLAGGINMDLGCYALSALRFCLASEPTRVLSAVPTIVKDNIDGAMEAQLEFDSGCIATYQVSMIRSMPSFLWNEKPKLHVIGEKGSVSMSIFIMPHVYHRIVLDIQGGPCTTETVYEDGHTSYWYSLSAMAAAVRADAKAMARPNFPFEWSINNQKGVDMVYTAASMPLRGKVAPWTQMNAL